jgi:hypothetical protein
MIEGGYARHRRPRSVAVQQTDSTEWARSNLLLFSQLWRLPCRVGTLSGSPPQISGPELDRQLVAWVV